MTTVARRVCAVDDCGRPHQARDYCQMHYRRWKRTGNPLIPGRVVSTVQRDGCDVEGCDHPHAAHGFCQLHHARWRRTGSPLGQGPLPMAEVVRLRRLEGLPDDGPTPEMRAAWKLADGLMETQTASEAA